MTSPLNAVRDSIATLWEATTPPTRTNVTYERLVDKHLNLGVAGDRTFRFTAGRIADMPSQHTGWTDRLWDFSAILRLSSAGRGLDEMNDAIENESTLLFRRVELNTSWATGVLSVRTDTMDYDWEGENETSDALVTLNFQALIQERD